MEDATAVVRTAASRGRPRSQARRSAVLDAAIVELVARGIRGMAIESVAERAGVSKVTIYRWWPDKIALTLDALRQLPELEAPDTGSLEGDLRALRVGLVELLETTPLGDVLPALIAERHRSEHGEAIRAYIDERSSAFGEIVDRAIARGELPAVLDRALVTHIVASPLSASTLLHDEPLDDREWTEAIKVIAAGLTAQEETA